MTALTERIRLKCVECGDCLLWHGAVNRGGFPFISSGRKAVSVRRAVYEEKHGPIPAGLVVAPVCGHKACVSDGCLEAMTRKESARRAAARGAFITPASIRARTVTRRSQSKYRDVIARVKNAKHGTLKAVAEEVGMSYAFAKLVRQGKKWAELNNPFAGLMG